MKLDMIASLKLKHGHSRQGQMTQEFRAWFAAKERCYNPNHIKYHEYGGRGIRMAEVWLNDFSAFLEHIGPKPDPKMSLDRIDVNGHYEPGNVRWATASTQRLNQRRMAA